MEGGGWREEGGGWRVEGGGRRVEGGGSETSATSAAERTLSLLRGDAPKRISISTTARWDSLAVRGVRNMSLCVGGGVGGSLKLGTDEKKSFGFWRLRV